MEIATLNPPPMPCEYYRQQAARVRRLAQEATTPALRGHLADVALQYEKLAESAVGRAGAARVRRGHLHYELGKT